jgi:hypothetical protein
VLYQDKSGNPDGLQRRQKLISAETFGWCVDCGENERRLEWGSQKNLQSINNYNRGKNTTGTDVIIFKNAFAQKFGDFCSKYF